MMTRKNTDLKINTWEMKKGIISKVEWKENREKILRLARVRKIMGGIK